MNGANDHPYGYKRTDKWLKVYGIMVRKPPSAYLLAVVKRLCGGRRNIRRAVATQFYSGRQKILWRPPKDARFKVFTA